MLVELGDASLASLPCSRTLIPQDMPHQVAWREVNGGVESQGDEGCLVHGPYERIDREGSYLAELAFLASAEHPGQPAGRFEVSCFRDGRVETLAATELRAASGCIGTAMLLFSTLGRPGWLLETRVFVEAGARLNALSIRAIQDGAQPEQ